MGAVRMNGEPVPVLPAAYVTVDLPVSLHEAMLRVGASLASGDPKDHRSTGVLFRELRAWHEKELALTTPKEDGHGL